MPEARGKGRNCRVLPPCAPGGFQEALPLYDCAGKPRRDVGQRLDVSLPSAALCWEEGAGPDYVGLGACGRLLDRWGHGRGEAKEHLGLLLVAMGQSFLGQGVGTLRGF